MVRTLLYEAATVLLTIVKRFSSLKSWGPQTRQTHRLQEGVYRACAQARRRPHVYHQGWDRVLVVRPRGDRLRERSGHNWRMSNLIERQHLDPEEGDALVIPKSFRHRDMGDCALSIGDTNVADTIMGHLSSDPAENRATLALDDAFRSILDATAAIRERSTNS